MIPAPADTSRHDKKNRPPTTKIRIIHVFRSSRNSDAGATPVTSRWSLRPRAGDVEQMALGVIDLLQIGVVADRLDALLQRNDLIVAGHDHHGAKLQPLGQMHGADRDMTAGGFDLFVENLERHSGSL